MLYFEEIFNKIIVLWKEIYPLSRTRDTLGAIYSMKEDFVEIEWYVEEKNKTRYNDWDGVMVFIVYQVLTDYALTLDKLENIVNIKKIPTISFEKQWRCNFSKQVDLEYEQYYKGFKNKENATILLGEYLQQYSLSLRIDNLD